MKEFPFEIKKVSSTVYHAVAAKDVPGCGTVEIVIVTWSGYNAKSHANDYVEHMNREHVNILSKRTPRARSAK